MNKTITSALIALASAGLLTAAPKKAPERVPVRTDARIEQEIGELISKMTLEEKVGQLNQLTGTGYSADMRGQIRNGNVGSILNEVDPVTINKLQKIAVDSSRLHIPIVFSRDVIHGFKTIFPIPIGQGATWNEAIVEKGARIAAEEASSVGVRWTFSPMVDIARDSRWGRLAEGYGEDPLLTSRMGVATVKGYQTDDLTKSNTMAACTKHFAAYGAAESGRDYNTTWIPNELLEDIYLPPFKACADAGSATFMCSFNDINGTPSSANNYINIDILRNRWGFDGLLVSDWGSIAELINHGIATDRYEAAELAINAGVDMDMEGHAYLPNIKKLLEDGKVTEEQINKLVADVLRLKYRLGLFDNPYVDEKTASRFYSPEALEAAQKCAEEAAILLKNNGTLPFKKSQVKKILLTGPMADAAHDQNGTWCFDLDKTHTVTVLKGMQEKFGKDNVFFVPGLAYSRDKNTSGFAAAVEAAKDADVIVFVGGEEAVLSGEAHSRADISLPGAQTALLKALAETGKPLVTVLMAGRPLTIATECELSDALLFNFHPGTMGGPAIANLLAGEVNPSGHLPISFPKMVGQEPLYYNHKNTGRPASNIVLIDDIPLEAGQTSTGCTSFFLDAGDGPLFPFGYGLSYTAFEYGTPTLSATEMPADGEITVSCNVTNVGEVEGQEVVQLYTHDRIASLARPVKELKNFEKISLKPGETKAVTFKVPASSLGFCHKDGKSYTEPGDFELWIAGDCQSGTPVSFKVTK